MADALRLMAHLATGFAGDAPHLDSLLVYVASRLGGKHTEPGYKVDRRYPCPDTSKIAIPLTRRFIGGFHVAMCSSPILGEVTDDRHEYIAKRLGVEHSGLLATDEQRMVATTNGWTKSYRLPLRTRSVKRVAWLCVGNRREILKSLRYVPAIGKKISNGFGRIVNWECEQIGKPEHQFWPWWIDSEAGPVLMRPLPLCGELPKGLIGAKRGYGACVDPYWHSDRDCERVEPC